MQIASGLHRVASRRIIHTPGHTPGSVAVHVPAVDALFLVPEAVRLIREAAKW